MVIEKLPEILKGCPFCGKPIMISRLSETIINHEIDLCCNSCNYEAHFKLPFLTEEERTQAHVSKRFISFEDVWNSRIDTKEGAGLINE